MMNRKAKSNQVIAALKRAARAGAKTGYALRLYVAGLTPLSVNAIKAVKRICDEHLKGRYRLEVIDIHKKPALAKCEQIVAAPTLIKKLPLPLRRIIGSMADAKKILVGLDVWEKEGKKSA